MIIQICNETQLLFKLIMLPIIIFCLIHLSQTFTLSTLVKKQKQTNSSIKLPIISKQLTILQQQQQFAQNHESFQFQQFYGDPSLNCQFTLDKNRVEESLWFIGKEGGEIKIELHVLDNHQGKMQGVKLYIIDHNQQEVIVSKYITSILLFARDEIYSNVYEIKVINTQPEISKNVSILINIQVPTDIQHPMDKDAINLLRILKQATERIDQIFINSLEQWHKISHTMSIQLQNQNNSTNIALYQMLFIILINIGTFYLLVRQINKKILV